MCIVRYSPSVFRTLLGKQSSPQFPESQSFLASVRNLWLTRALLWLSIAVRDTWILISETSTNNPKKSYLSLLITELLFFLTFSH